MNPGATEPKQFWAAPSCDDGTPCPLESECGETNRCLLHELRLAGWAAYPVVHKDHSRPIDGNEALRLLDFVAHFYRCSHDETERTIVLEYAGIEIFNAAVEAIRIARTRPIP